MKNQDPVLEVLEKLNKTAPEKIKPLIKAYKEKGLEGLDTAWKDIIKETINENQ